ncbi:hypothetical protein H7F15_04255 [Pontibacter sp. Tf4]|uniref:hypothetical protein n=1 Tax=Pontibacter sp. Tf4 TaxID=2761620 RepID=UPI001625E31A|nr:hypothetical protein [Pontibacter sp. Tf4]MBB6610241.1 hypothetical protein [Pontibacter sp. Tf4]
MYRNIRNLKYYTAPLSITVREPPEPDMPMGLRSAPEKGRLIVQKAVLVEITHIYTIVAEILGVYS